MRLRAGSRSGWFVHPLWTFYVTYFTPVWVTVHESSPRSGAQVIAEAFTRPLAGVMYILTVSRSFLVGSVQFDL